MTSTPPPPPPFPDQGFETLRKRVRKAAIAAAIAAPLFCGASAAFVLFLPFLAPFLLPMSAGRLIRAGEGTGNPDLWAFAAAVLTVPVSFLFGAALVPGGTAMAPSVALITMSLPALSVRTAARQNRRTTDVTVVCSAIVGVLILGLVLALELGSDQYIGTLWGEAIADFGTRALQFYRTSGFSESAISSLENAIGYAVRAVTVAGPGIALAAGVLYAAFVVYTVPFPLIPSLSVSEPAFSEFRLPTAAAILFVGLGVSATLTRGPSRQAALWLLIPLLALFFLQGLAIIRALLDKWSSGAIVRILVFALVLQMPLPGLVALFGLADEFFDFRDRFTRPEQPDEI